MPLIEVTVHCDPGRLVDELEPQAPTTNRTLRQAATMAATERWVMDGAPLAMTARIADAPTAPSLGVRFRPSTLTLAQAVSRA